MITAQAKARLALHGEPLARQCLPFNCPFQHAVLPVGHKAKLLNKGKTQGAPLLMLLTDRAMQLQNTLVSR